MKSIPALVLAGLCGAYFSFPLAASEEAAAPVLSSTEETAGTTILIRYDPETIFLTHGLVEPICRNEVRLAQDGAAEPLARLELLPMEGNELQPRGVFVGQVRILWLQEKPSGEHAGQRLLNAGLEQLRGSLSRRLFESKKEALSGRLQVLERMAENSQEQLDKMSRERAARERRAAYLEAARRVDEELQATLQERDVLRPAMIQGVKDVEAQKGQIARVQKKLAFLKEDLDRQKRLQAKDQVSDARVSEAEVAVVDANVALSTATTQFAASEADAALLAKQLEAIEVRVESLERKRVRIAMDIKEGSEAPADSRAAAEQGLTPELELGWLQEQVRELRLEMQRVKLQLATLVDVRIERW